MRSTRRTRVKSSVPERGAEGNGKDNPEEVTADCITATRVRFLPERNVQQNGAVTRNLVGKDVFWVDVETMGANPDKVASPDDEQDDEGVTENPLG